MFELGTCYRRELVIPFQDMLDKDPYISLDKVEGVLRNYYTVDGKMMCIPLNPSSPVMYYNKDAFAKAGITEVPTTFKEIEAIAEKLTAPEGNPKYAMGLSIYGWFFENLLAGLPTTPTENGRAGVSTAIEYDTNGGGALVLESWKRLVDEGICFNFGVDNAGSAAAFIAGDTAITFESTAQLTTITNGAEFEVGAAYLPSVLDESIGGVLIGGANLWLTKQDDDQKVQDAWEFIKFATSAEPAAKFSMATGYFAANTTAYVPACQHRKSAQTLPCNSHDSPLNNVTAGAFVGVMGELRRVASSMELYCKHVHDGSFEADPTALSSTNQTASK